ncbi:MAG: acyltransferase family protein [Actinomycetota bacterium]
MRILQIQGLRAFAAILVIIFHARLLGGGFIGVDIFYVISGYLITGLIVREIKITGTLNFRHFYVRRLKRLLPTSSFVLVVTAITSWILLPPNVRTSIGRDVIAASLYISNYLFAWWQNDYQNLDATPSPLLHYWSLAVEEQFYLLWPIFIFALTKIRKRGAVVIGISIATALSLVISIIQTESSPIWAFYSLPTRAWELGAGALLVLAPKLMIRNSLIAWVTWAGVVGLFFSAIHYNSDTPFPGINAVIPVLATVLLIATVNSWPPILNDLSNNKVAQWLGAISYPLYLWHWPVLVLPSTYLGRPLHLYERGFCILLTVLLAGLTHRLIEEPLHRNKNLRPRTVLFAAIGATLASTLLGLSISATASTQVTVSGKSTQTFSLEKIMRKPLVYNDGCQVNYGDSLSGKCTYGDLTSAKTIVLYGDSHAAQWFPALARLAKEEHFKLVSLTKSACPSAEVPRSDRGAYKDSECVKWRKNSVKRIQTLKPMAVILSGSQHYGPPPGVKDRATWWRNGEILALTALSGSSQNLIYIADTPHPARDIPSCLAAHGGKLCDTSVPSQYWVVPGFSAINPTPWLCTTYCPAIKNGIVTYRDASHIAVDMSIALAPQLRNKLRQLRVL